MKKLILLIIISYLGLNLYAQLIPDDNFRMKINEHLGQPQNYEPTVEDLNSITSVLYAGSSDILSIEGAQYLINISSLILLFNSIYDITSISGLTNLLELNLNHNQINDISAISGLTNLINLDLSYNQISNISAVSDLTNLTHLYINNNQIIDISTISGHATIIEFNLNHNQINDIAAISGLTNLTYLHLNYNQISDISAISGLTNLTHLGLQGNLICDINALSTLTDLLTLDLSGNQINDITIISGLINLYTLWLVLNQITDISALVENTGLGAGDMLFLEEAGYSNPLSQEAIDIHIPILESRGFDVLQSPSSSNIYAACYPDPARNTTGLSVNTILEWRGSNVAQYEVWLGESSDNLDYLGTGSASNDTLFSFTPNLVDDTSYWWRVCAITDDDEFWSGLWHFTVGNPVENGNQLLTLDSSQIEGIFPNPFNPTTTIKYNLNTAGFTSIDIYNIKGQVINSLINKYQNVGKKTINWNGIDSKGYPVSSGLYFIDLNINGKSHSRKKCLLLK